MKTVVLNGCWYGREMRPSGALISGASVFRDSQRIVTPQGDRAVVISIAPDSDLDCCDIWTDGNDQGLPIARVSARRPWWGKISADAILVVPGRTLGALVPTHYPIERYGANVEPRLAVNVYTERDLLPAWMPEQRAIMDRNWKTSSTVGVLTLYAVTTGRRVISVASEITSLGGAASATIAIAGLDGWSENGTQSVIVDALASDAGLVVGDAPVYAYEGAPYDLIRITITPSDLTKAVTVAVNLKAED